MEQVISYINQFIALLGMRNLIIIGVILVLFIIAIVIYRSLRLKVCRSEIVDIAKDYDHIVDFLQNELNPLVNEVDEQLFYGKLRGANKKMAKLRVMTDRYEKESQVLLKKIEKVTEIENVQRIEIIRVKEKYRTVTNQYDAIRIKVESFVPEINEIFKSIDEDFVKLEGMMNNQLFDDAKAFTSQIEGRIDALSESMKDLPSYVSVVKQLLPSKVINEAGAKLESLTDHIESLAVDLTKEKESYKKFKEQWSKITTIVDKTRVEYDECYEDYQVLKQKFVIDEEKMTLVRDYDDFKLILDEYADLKNKLDSGEFAYTDMLENVEAMIRIVTSHKQHIIDFIKGRDNLYAIEKRANDEIENINIVLLEIKSEIKNNHLPMINESYKDYIADSYEKAREIKAYKAKAPVNLEELSKKVDGARDVIYKLYDNVHNLIITAIYANMDKIANTVSSILRWYCWRTCF